jgi:lysozyme family protein
MVRPGAVKAIQAALGVTVDGQLGPKTIAACTRDAGLERFCLAFAEARVSICVEDVRRDLVQHYGAARSRRRT